MYAKFKDEKQELYRWDTGQYIEVSKDVDRIDFQFRSTRDMVWGVFAENGIVPIPDVVLQSCGVLDLLIMVDSGSVYTMERMEVPVIDRPIPPGYVMTERGQLVTYTDLSSILGKFDLLQKSGGTMTGDINMDGHTVTGLDDPEEDGEAVSLHYARTTYLPLAGGTMTGRLTGMQQPVSDDEAANKQYVDSQTREAAGNAVGTSRISDGAVTREKIGANAVSNIYKAVITAAGWSKNGQLYQNRVSIPGILETDNLVISLDSAADTSYWAEAHAESFGYIYRAIPGNGSVTFYAYEKPVDIGVKLLCVRR